MVQRWVVSGFCCAVAAVLIAADPDKPSAQTDASRATQEIRVATWNTYLLPSFLEGGGVLRQSDGACRARESGKYLEAFSGPLDVVALQEVFDATLQRKLTDNLTRLALVEGPSPSACERDGPCALHSGGLALLGGSKVHFGKTVARGYSVCLGPDCLANKGFLYAPVRFSKNGNVDLHVLLTHLQASGRGDRVRSRQLAQVRRFLEATVCADGRDAAPVILLGDLNTANVLGVDPGDISNMPYRKARQSLRLTCLGEPSDVFDGNSEQALTFAGTKNCSGGLLPSPCRRPESERRLDHIWYWSAGDRLRFRSGAVDAAETSRCKTRYLSDHRLVWARFTIQP